MAIDTTNCLINGGTWTTVQTYLGAADTEKTFVEGIINAASWRANSETKRLLLARDRTDYYDGKGGVTLLTRQSPVNAMSGIFQDTAYVFGTDTEITTDEYQLYSEMGNGVGMIVLTTTVFTIGPRVIKVMNNEGYSTVPADLEMAVIELCMDIYKRLREKRVVVGSVSVEGKSISYTGELPTTVRKVFDLYRRDALA